MAYHKAIKADLSGTLIECGNVSEGEIISKLLESICIKPKEAALEKYSIHSINRVLMNHYQQSKDEVKIGN